MFLNKIGPSLLWAFASRHGADYLTNDFFHNGHPTIGRQYGNVESCRQLKSVDWALQNRRHLKPPKTNTAKP